MGRNFWILDAIITAYSILLHSRYDDFYARFINVLYDHFKAEFEDVTKYFSFQLVTSLVMPTPVMFLKISMMVCSN